MNDEDSINQLFEEVLQKMGKDIAPGTKEVFSLLVKETLKYRDGMVTRGEEPITSGEVEKALAIFQKTIETGVFPKAIPARIEPLLESWVAALTLQKK